MPSLVRELKGEPSAVCSLALCWLRESFFLLGSPVRGSQVLATSDPPGPGSGLSHLDSQVD